MKTLTFGILGKLGEPTAGLDESEVDSLLFMPMTFSFNMGRKSYGRSTASERSCMAKCTSTESPRRSATQSGKGKLRETDNARYPEIKAATVENFIRNNLRLIGSRA